MASGPATSWEIDGEMVETVPDFIIKNIIKDPPREKHDPKGSLHPSVHCSAVYDTQDMEKNSMSTNREMDKEDVVHRYNGILLSHKKE